MDNKTSYKPRILINSDIISEEYNKFLQSTDLNIDIRSINKIGVSDAADILNEYDIIILNLINPYNVIPERIAQLVSFLKNKDKILIYFLHNFLRTAQTTNLAFISNLFSIYGIPGDLFNVKASGSNFILEDTAKSCPFYDYLNVNKKEWKLSFDKKYFNKIEPIALNKDGDAVAFSMKEFILNTYFIPWNEENELELWDLVRDLAFGSTNTQEPISEWVNNYSFKKLSNLIEEIDALKVKIEDLENEKNSLEILGKDLLLIRDTLLYRDGRALEKVVKKVLIELGIDAKDGNLGREDLTFIYKDKHFVIEVKGATKSTAEKHITQLHGKKIQYEKDNKVKSKGVLIVNAWRLLPIEERNTNDKPIFPEQIMTLVNIWSLSLVTTQQLFVAYCDNLEGKFDLEEFIKKIDSTNGIMEGYDDIKKYKIT